ncbi:MAG: leucine-rich repeat domain-containing protein [Clostridiales bacterium]|nr:leucine-rich repeat domain-containing protein [Clostridiales bacterium]
MTRGISVVLVMFMLLFCCAASASTLTMPDALVEIRAEAFYRNTSIESVVLDSKVQTIGARAFAYSSLKSITIPASVRTIADDAFLGCSGLVIYGKTGSAAETFAKKKGFTFRGSAYMPTGMEFWYMKYVGSDEEDYDDDEDEELDPWAGYEDTKIGGTLTYGVDARDAWFTEYGEYVDMYIVLIPETDESYEYWEDHECAVISSNEDVARIEDYGDGSFMVSVIALGTTKITATTDTGLTASFTLKVVQDDEASGRIDLMDYLGFKPETMANALGMTKSGGKYIDGTASAEVRSGTITCWDAIKDVMAAEYQYADGSVINHVRIEWPDDGIYSVDGVYPYVQFSDNAYYDIDYQIAGKHEEEGWTYICRDGRTGPGGNYMVKDDLLFYWYSSSGNGGRTIDFVEAMLIKN